MDWLTNQLKPYGEKISRKGYGEILIDKKELKMDIDILKMILRNRPLFHYQRF